jgi:hypothetical protein
MTPRIAATMIFASLAFAATSAVAKVDLVTLPQRDKVQITIYNSADLTLVRDARTLTLRKGANRLQYSWANTLIDPTSLEMIPKARAREVSVGELNFPPRVNGLGIWTVDSTVAEPVPMEITCFTSGVSWRAYYLATLTPDESAMELAGYVRVDNRSGEDYENAETRLVVGQISLLDRIADLSRRQQPYGRPGFFPQVAPAPMASGRMMKKESMDYAVAKSVMAEATPKEIVKEGLSEYFLYSIEGTEDIANGWGKRLISFTAPKVPVVNLFRYEEERYGDRPTRFVSFVNDEKHTLGKEPIPGGLVKVFRTVDAAGALSYVGAQEAKYVPKGGEIDLNLGPTEEVDVKPTIMDLKTFNYEFDQYSIIGWDERWTVKVEVANHRAVPAKVEVRRNFPTTAWEIVNEGETGEYAKVDADTVGYTQTLPAHTKRTFTYTVTYRMGSRAR